MQCALMRPYFIMDDDSSYRLNFDPDKKDEIYQYILITRTSLN
jgi:hypothetical protein